MHEPDLPTHQRTISRVAIVFAGGPAPASNAVISTAAASFLRADVSVLGILHGYLHLVEYTPDQPLVAGTHFRVIDEHFLRRTRNTQGIMIGTSRTNPGKLINGPADLEDPQRCEPLRRVYQALRSLGVDALVSIGGDDTLKTANKLKMYQDRQVPESERIPVVHLPKTIDNDYMGIDFTFGYFTAVDFLGTEIRNLIYDAEAAQSYFICETMGRSAGWLAYGAAIAGEASLVVSVEDIVDKLASEEESVDRQTGATTRRTVMNVSAVVDRMVLTMETRDGKGKPFGVIVMAEGLAEYLPDSYLEGIPRDDHDHIAIGEINLGRLFADMVAEAYERKTGRKRRVIGLQLGYESRCARPHAFDVMLGSQLGVGAYRALIEEKLDGVMVSVSGQLDLHYVDFRKLVNPETLVTTVRYIIRGSDFHLLARFMETHVHG